MGEVYRAHDTCLDRCVAVKILPSHLSSSPELKSRFEREAKTLSSVSHPHICHLYDVGSQDGVDFLVMELLEGETLATRLMRGPLSLQDLLKIGMEIADALARAHRLGITHRDLKPSNIMLTKTGAKLMDFGLAKPSTLGAVITPSSSAAATATLQSPATPISTVGMVVGTIHYMSPEQIEGTKMMSVLVQVQPAFRAGKAVELFDRKFDRGGTVGGYDVSPDGQTANPTEVRVVVGWSLDQSKK